jgi:K+-sensing histidine kinase KdpD
LQRRQRFCELGRTRVDDHHGLGLSIVRAIAIAVAHDATLTANARPQGGLSIEIHVPLIPFAMPRWAAAETLERPASGQRTRRSG